MSFTYAKQVVALRVGVADTGTLFFSGTIDKEAVKGFVFKHGAYNAESDALGRRDQKPFIDLLVEAARYRIHRQT